MKVLNKIFWCIPRQIILSIPSCVIINMLLLINVAETHYSQAWFLPHIYNALPLSHVWLIIHLPLRLEPLRSSIPRSCNSANSLKIVLLESCICSAYCFWVASGFSRISFNSSVPTVPKLVPLVSFGAWFVTVPSEYVSLSGTTILNTSPSINSGSFPE